MIGLPPTDPQREYVAGLCRKLHITDAALDGHCVRRYNAPYHRLDRQQVSDLLDEMTGWETTPADMRRAMGQLDLFGVQS
jgi:hypothetical protein